MRELENRVAILIPTYNSGKYISDTLESLEAQDAGFSDPLSVHIADDCSTDDTIDIVTKRPKGRLELTVTKSPQNMGERHNVNAAADLLRAGGASWILILHSDDIAKPSWLRTMCSRIAACDKGVGTICSSYDHLLPDGTVVPGEDDPARSVERIAGNLAAVRGTLRRGCWWHISGCAIRTVTLEDVGAFKPEMPQTGDWEWLLRCLRRGWAVEYIPRTLIVYRQHLQSVSSLSIAKSRDILESLSVARTYSDVMPAREVVGFHLTRQKFVLLRMGRALTEFRLWRVAHLVGVMGRVGINLLRCIGRGPIVAP
jgi:glycosyltransferase involved in cell wall biosynthesis